MCMHKGELANINPPRITTEPYSRTEFDVLYGNIFKCSIYMNVS